MCNFLANTYGFSDDDLANVYDHRLILLALDAQKYREGKQKSDIAKKKIVKLPKLSKPGAKKNEANEINKALRKKRLKLKKTGSTADLANVLRDLI
jgi:hypothetical protein